MCAYIHIMLTGQSTDHIDTAIADRAFKPIKKIYLIHSANEKKATGHKKTPTLFKNIALDCKKRIEKNSTFTGKVKLFQIDNAFDAVPTILAIKRIFDDEIEYIGSKQNIVVNVTGGTNMMAVGAMIAAGSQQTSAYYVLDNRFHKNLETYLRRIQIPDFKMDAELAENEQKVLYEISKSKFEWPHTPKNERVRVQNILDPRKHYWIRKVVDDSIDGSEWMYPKTVNGAITLSKQKSGKSGKNLGLNDVMKKHKTRTGKTFDDKTVARVLTRLQKRGLVIQSKNVPEMTPVWGGGDNKRQEYRIKARSVLITITEAGKVELRGYDK